MKDLYICGKDDKSYLPLVWRAETDNFSQQAGTTYAWHREGVLRTFVDDDDM